MNTPVDFMAQSDLQENLSPTLRLGLTYALGLAAAGVVLVLPVDGTFFGPQTREPGFLLTFWCILAWCAVGVLWQAEGRPRLPAPEDWPWDFPIRAGLLFLAGPYLLFAQRNRMKSRTSRGLCAVLPHTLALGVWGFLWGQVLRKIAHEAADAVTAVSWPLFLGLCGGCGLLHVLGPWPRQPRYPLLGGLPGPPKVHPLVVLGLFAVFFIPLGIFARGVFWHVVSGDFLSYRFRLGDVGALDNSGLYRGYFHLLLFTLMSAPIVASARWMSERNTLRGYTAFAVPCLAWAVLMGSFWVLLSHGMYQYILSMGWTLQRLKGVAVLAAWLTGMAAFLYWSLRPPKKGEPGL